MKNGKAIELPKFICHLLTENRFYYRRLYPLYAVAYVFELMEENQKAHEWLDKNTINQWKLIKAIRYGYV